MQSKRPTGGLLMNVRKLEKGQNGFNSNQINPQTQLYNAIQSTSNHHDIRIVSKTQFPKAERKTQEFSNAQNYHVNDSQAYKLSNTSLPERNSFNKKPKVSETYSASDVKQTKSDMEIKSSNNSVPDKIAIRMNSFQGFTTQTLEYLQKGDMTKFLTEYEKFDPHNRKKIKELKEYYKKQQIFYKKLKLIISNGCDSQAFFSDLSFNFFDDIPQIFNKMLTELSNRLKTFESFKEGNKKYLSSNTNQKIEDNFDRFMKAISLLKSDKDKGANEMKAAKNQLARKNNEITDLKQKVTDLQLKLKLVHFQKGEDQLIELKNKLEKSEDNEWRLNSQLRQLQTKYQYQTIDLEQYKNKFLELSDENNNLKFDVKELVGKISRSDKIIDQLKQQVNSLQIQLQKVQIAPKSSFKTNQIAERDQKQDLKMQLEEKNKEIFDYKRLIYQLRTNQDDYQRKISQLEEKMKQQSISKKQDLSKYYLESSWLLEYKDTSEKSRLIKMIKNYCNYQPLQFKLLYKYQKFQQSNFHDYIDNKSNFLILIKLINNIVIGGFCPYPLARNLKPNAGFLFNLTSNALYPLKQGKACYIYDDFYLTMGNSQIRIRMSDNFVYSSFGIQNEHFQSKNHTIGNFFDGCDTKSTQREMGFIGYEVYEVKIQY